MPSANGFLTDTTNLAQSTAGTTAPDPEFTGFDAQGLTVTLVGMAGALFFFAALNTLNRTATVKVRKR